MNSNTGNNQTHVAGDQRTGKASDDAPQRYDEGKDNAHNIMDSKDQRTIKNNLAAAETVGNRDENKTVEDPLLPARMNGNEPSRGAEIDAELKAEEEEYLRRKGKI